MTACQSLPIALAPDGDWTPESVIVLDALNQTDHMVSIAVQFRGESHEMTARMGIFPGLETRLALPLSVLTGETLFVGRTPGRFKTVVSGGRFPFDDLREVIIGTRGGEGDVATIRNLHVAGEMPTEFPVESPPIADSLHQWAQRDWPGKTGSLEEMRERLEAELSGPEPSFPDGWSRYGGWRAKQFQATGWFRAEHDGSRWWLVDPEGCAFWSMGPNCVRTDPGVNTLGILSLFEEALPSADDRPDLWVGDIFEAGAHNLERALGEGWFEKWQEITRRRLIALGMNTIANWSDSRIWQSARLPYTLTLGDFPTTGTLLFRDFPDVFADEFSENATAFAKQLEQYSDDACIIGYFMTNEPKWAFVDAFDLGKQILLTDTQSAARSALIERLAAKYPDVGALNAAWRTSLASFDDLHRGQPESALGDCAKDTLPFTAEAVERYVSIPAVACAAVDPNHMNLGTRWAWIHSDYQLAGAEHLAAFSINQYATAPRADEIMALSEKTGKPVMIGEFHTGALDRGLPIGGLRSAATTEEKAVAYRHYMEQAAAIPALVGAHWFLWCDQHVLGRFDGENFSVGINDICYRPYDEMVEALRTVHPFVYEIAAGKSEPTTRPPEEIDVRGI